MASAKGENETVGGGKMKTWRPFFFPTLTSSLILILLFICPCNNTTPSPYCYVDGSLSLRDVETVDYICSSKDNVNDTMKYTSTIWRGWNTWCIVAYTIEEYTYVIDNDRRTACTPTLSRRCALRLMEYQKKISTNFVCCCNTTKCNDPVKGAAMNPRLQYEKQLKENGSQACFVRHDKSAIQDCTRMTNQNETKKTPSRCLSVRKPNGVQVLGCAHNGTMDRCDWAGNQNGSCRLNPQNNYVECCCLGAYCNGDAYMNLSCPYKSENTSDFGARMCATRPSTTASNSTTNPAATTTITKFGKITTTNKTTTTTTELTTTTTNTKDTTTNINPNTTTTTATIANPTTTTNSNNMMLIVALSVCGVLLLVMCAVAVACFCQKKAKSAEHSLNEDNSDDSDVEKWNRSEGGVKLPIVHDAPAVISPRS